MDPQPLTMAVEALGIIFDPMRLVYLVSGVLMGLVLGIIPGLGGLVGLSILLPFTFAFDPYTALAMMIGLSAVTVTSDTIPAVLFSVPGTVGSAATILDGFPMARRGEAGRALGAAFTASVLGGLFGALVLGVSIPVLRPLVLLIGSPELLAICILGLSLVASLSANAPLKGMAAVCIGIIIAMVGEDPQTATMRWTFDTLYLWDGFPIVPVALGLFALPEIADLAIVRRAIAGGVDAGSRWTQLQGVRDVLRNWWLTLRCSAIGATLGTIPGIGAAVIDWIAYGHAARTVKGAADTFGKGDVRGVIASESSNNAKEGGALIPTMAFGVPGSASMALLLGAFLVHDIVPGPELLASKLDITYTIVWSIAVANVFGAGICFLFANQLAKIALIRIGVLAPVIIGVSFIGVYQGSANWGDLFAVLGFGVLGWTMKRMDWPRPPVILGFVLGALFERYLFISVNRYAFEWLSFPIVIVLLAIAAYTIAAPTIRSALAERRRTGSAPKLAFARPAGDRAKLVFTGIVMTFFVGILASSWTWPFDAKLVPVTVAWGGLFFAALHLAGRFTAWAPQGSAAAVRTAAGAAPDTAGQGELDSRQAPDPVAALATSTVLARAGAFLGWLLVYLGLTALIGMLPAMFLFQIAFMRVQGRESWLITLVVSLCTSAFAYLLFHRVVNVAWPHALLGDWFPALRSIEALNIL